ncbi:hypothetical protein Kpol_1019p1 [Vanderwaltozyma polyspora DSM 70294]|uniref:V-type proton ATPase subunit a n=1 Tax=Vanderwaltozyma polyspora (strain ATCC 22028 / DSM 70294 / BCRC 21397 / CBS 2163 / NBRC 10782 / NRRL Y-8283 / UCD 57-17) TaxID=436907 RepID=A7TP94_VANPO|nr:uncharacterized protein Kpol_1019p1 [Vanderwaltozyma polyspora DSM 70294]EDO15881.1 hypothetical protein Kpol_1019p1 [Vanderwaltozyma polyspora DSM 70294]
MFQEEAIFRSADMAYIQLYIPLEISREIVSMLGNLGNVMFRDLNSNLTAFQRGYVSHLQRYNDIERLLNYLGEVSVKHSEAVWKYTLHVDEQGNDIETPHISQIIAELDVNSQDAINDVMDDIISFESRVKQLDDSLVQLKIKLNDLIEQRYVFFECGRFLEANTGLAGRLSRDNMDANDFRLNSDDLSDNLSEAFSFDDDTVANTDLEEGLLRNDLARDEEIEVFDQVGFNNNFMIVGSIKRSKVELLNRIVWRLLRGNLFFQNFSIDETLLENGEKVEKDCFIIFTHGETLLKKVKRVVESLEGHIYPMEDRSHDRIQELNTQINDVQQIVYATEQTLHTELLVVNDQLPKWTALVKREKYIYATLNLFKDQSQGLLAEGWVPASEMMLVSNSLKEHGEQIGSEYTPVINVIQTNKTPPTYHRTNKFTGAFQSIVDAYGIASYKEINPGLATIVTFPFMFAIMFGDAGHGFILLLIALFLIMNEKKFEAMQREEIFDMAFTGRYMICLMGFFSIYTGLMYNDVFSKSMTLFKSGWEWPSSFKKGESIEATKVGVYPFGLDFAWHGTDNNLIFTNSYKMKLSILMGFIHMSYSYLFSYVNFKYKNSKVDIIGNFLPGLIFMQSIFGYLSWAILYKWTRDWIKEGKPAPNLLNMLINMFLAPGTVSEQLYKGQSFIQMVLLIAALVCVPWLLLYKPLMLRKQHNQAQLQGYQNINEQRVNESLLDSQSNAGDEVIITEEFNKEDQHEFNFGDIVIHQVIHTIEFCLNCISHTASYLRLWALSLAHAQLSTVLWDMTIANSFSSANSGSPFAVAKVVFLFGMWFVLTVCILVLMEGTSAMLHSLRLHWVEAMSKFFEGDGYAYEPFSFKKLSD